MQQINLKESWNNFIVLKHHNNILKNLNCIKTSTKIWFSYTNIILKM